MNQSKSSKVSHLKNAEIDVKSLITLQNATVLIDDFLVNDPLSNS